MTTRYIDLFRTESKNYLSYDPNNTTTTNQTYPHSPNYRYESYIEFIDFDNARICMFNLNNYLDILKNGVYVSEHSTYAHEGLVVLLDARDYYKDNRIIMRINWSYNAGVFTCKLDVEDQGFFNTKVCGDVPVQVCRDYWDITSGFLTISAKKERQYNDSNLRLLMLKRELEKEQRNNAELKQWLDDNKDN